MEDIAYDILAEIISYCKMSDLFSLFRLCRKWRKFSKSEIGCKIQIMMIYEHIFGFCDFKKIEDLGFKHLYNSTYTEHLSRLKNFNLEIFSSPMNSDEDYSSPDNPGKFYVWDFENNIIPNLLINPKNFYQIPNSLIPNYDKVVSININNPICSTQIYTLLQFFDRFIEFLSYPWTGKHKPLIIICLCIKYGIKYTWTSVRERSEFVTILITEIVTYAHTMKNFIDQKMKFFLSNRNFMDEKMKFFLLNRIN